MQGLDALIQHIRRTFPDLQALALRTDDRYRSLPLCFIDAVYSIGVRYESTERTIDDFCRWADWNYVQEYTVMEFINLVAPYERDWERLAKQVFRNRQRTSSRSGILKAEAVCHFAAELRRCKIDKLSDLATVDPEEQLLSGITAIRGQSSGVSFKYFLMLAGYEGLVKPDRMVARFVADSLGEPAVTPTFAEALLLSAHRVLQADAPGLTAAMLDYHVWLHQRTRSGN